MRLRATLIRRLAAAAVVLTVFGAAAGAQEAVRVASKLDSESALLGNVILLVLEANGIKTADKLRLGPTNIVRRAIIAGEIDIYPEYTGNGALFYSLDGDPAWRSADAGYQKISALDRARQDLIWLAPAPADNSWVIAVPRDIAAALHLADMTDFAAWARRGGVKLAASAEFVESPAALPAFEKTYGFKLGPSALVVLAGGDTAVTMRAAAERISGVNAAMAYGTDGALAALNLVVLGDSERAQVIYAPAPVVRAAMLAKYPGMRDSLAAAFAALDGSSLRRLNARIAVDGEEVRQVAADYLKARGLTR
jgi:osmoprotectant transport system substrate-binding protein